jgi:hypothetical protein
LTIGQVYVIFPSCFFRPHAEVLESTQRIEAQRLARVAELADALDLGGNQEPHQKFAASSYAVVTSEFGAITDAPILLHPFHSHCIREATGVRP